MVDPFGGLGWVGEPDNLFKERHEPVFEPFFSCICVLASNMLATNYGLERRAANS